MKIQLILDGVRLRPPFCSLVDARSWTPYLLYVWNDEKLCPGGTGFCPKYQLAWGGGRDIMMPLPQPAGSGH